MKARVVSRVGAAFLLPMMAMWSCASRAGDLKLKPSPRLWVSPDTLAHLSEKLKTPYLQHSAERLLADADWLVDADSVAEGEAPSYQQGTRAIASHLKCLTTAWVLTRDPKYRAAAIRHLANLMNWNQISCEASFGMPYEKELFFGLSYGEHAADIGFMYDVFRSDITPEEQKVFFDVLDRFYLKQALRSIENPPWWANKSWSNWNGVCAGGMGILALAFYDDRPECRPLIPFVEKSLGEYFKSYIKNGGGCHEGTGYWNYGMHYAMRYLLSWERATGRQHPAFRIKELGTSLSFPLDFTGITFGDNDGWHPTGMFFMVADRLNQPGAALRAATYLVDPGPQETITRSTLSRTATGDILYAADFIPTPSALARLRKERMVQKEPVARVYNGLGWAALADDSAFPTMRLAGRGGSSEITGHGHLDLLSFKCMVNGQLMITDQSGGSPVNFTPYGHHLYSRSPAAKSTLFVDGLGCRENAVCDATESVGSGDVLGIRIDGSQVYLPRWRRGFIGRLLLMVENRYWLVIDSAPGHWMESRFHTYAECDRTGKASAVLRRGGQELQMTFAALTGGVLQESRGMPTAPQTQTHILRWIGRGPSYNSLQVSALMPGSERLDVQLARERGGLFSIQISGADGYTRTLRVTRSLQLRDTPR